ncbi:hypothetical protein [Pseudomonas piscis]|uniref:Uncharacterized protein n=1 Tax=Pseudomonas piscis TaxID=2614538 RepID=A0A7X1PIP6_9PSED|nr:hypothetical protein [Pseudomonas piscis]MQA52914.1 hypothetical protein [Pseudomonas piscis]
MSASSMMASLSANSRRYEIEMRRLQKELSSAHKQDLRLQQKITGVFPRIANLQLEGGAQLSDEVQSLLEQREGIESGLREQLAQVDEAIARHLQEMATVSLDMEAVVADLEQRLIVEPGYQRQAALLAEAVESCNASMASYQELRDECHAKLQDFQAEPLYLYLKGRGFGSERYVGRTFFRTLDRWIARLCNFPQNNATEQSLLAMQKANEDAQLQRDGQRDIQEAELARLYQEALADTQWPVLEASLTTERDAAEAGKAQANSLHERLELFVSRKDEYFALTVELLSRQLAEMDALKLEHLAGQTATSKDDELVKKVGKLRAELDDLRQRIPHLEGAIQDAEHDYDMASRLEDDLFCNGYISHLYDYSWGLNFDALVAGFMAGELSFSQVANEVMRHRREFEPAPRPRSSGSSSSGSLFSSSSRSGSSNSSSRSGSSSNSSSGSSSRSSSSSGAAQSSSGSFSSSRSTGGGGFSTSDSL